MENGWKIVDFESLDNEIQELLKKAKVARENSYAPYSKFKVGSALRCADGSISTGCNVENCSHSPSICAERTAIVKAVSEGKTKFSAIGVIASHEKESFVAPCGLCRQTIAEFGNITVYMSRPELQKVLVSSLDHLLPFQFSLH